MCICLICGIEIEFGNRCKESLLNYNYKKNLIRGQSPYSIEGEGMKMVDKIVVIVGAVIIVLAAVGIAIWKPSPSKNPPQFEQKKYAVTWVKKTATISPDNTDYYAYDRIWIFGGDEPYVGAVSIPVYNLKSVKFVLTWEDDHVTGIFFKWGKDTLTFEVTAPDGSVKSEETKGSGTIEFIFDNINDIPPIDIIEANSTSEALEKVKYYYGDNWKDKPFQIKVSVDVGESIFTPIQRLMDNGNNFTLRIEYTYYEPEIEEIPETPPPETSATNIMEEMSLSDRLYPLFAYAGFH